MAEELITPPQASEFINTRATRYLNALDAIKGVFVKYKGDPASRGAIYSVYSRKDKQGGDEFKEAWKVADKVNRARTVGNPDKGIPRNLNFPIQDLSDIIGFTVVVVYPSDRDRVKQFVESQRGQELLVFEDEPKEERGYVAHHYVLGHIDPYYSGIRCEVQIKTILHDAWSAKTHDLTYKPQGPPDPRMQVQFEYLSDALSVIDKQSEALKKQIDEVWYVDEKRKNTARLALMRGMGLPKAADPERQRRYFDAREK